MNRIRVAAVLAPAVLVISAATAGPYRTVPRTVARVPAHIRALAQDGDRIAWLTPSRRCGKEVAILDLRRRHVSPVGLRRDAHCAGSLGALPALALAGKRVLWEYLTDYSLSICDATFVSAAIGEPRTRVVGGFGCDRMQDPAALAGDGHTLLFSGYNGARRIARGRSVPVRLRHQRIFCCEALAVSGNRIATVGRLPAHSSRSPAWSPDGGKIAFSWNQGKKREIDLVRADGGGRRRLIANALQPRWAPNGKWIAFTRPAASGTPSSVLVAAADGRGARRIAANASLPAWSPDSSRLSFVRGRDVWVVNADGSGERRLTTDGVGTPTPAVWAPDATALAAARDGSLRLIDTRDGHQTALTTDGALGPQWSPDGNTIAFVAGEGRVAVIRRDGSGFTYLTSEEELADREFDHLAWSPDGTRLAAEVVLGAGVEDIPPTWIVVLDAVSGRHLAASTSKVDSRSPCWSPDGQQLVFGGSDGLHVINADGRGLRGLEPDGWLAGEIHDAATGALVERWQLAGQEGISVAVSRRFGVVLVAREGRRELVRYAARGKLLGRTELPAATAADLSISGRRAVYRVGRRIVLLDVATGKSRTLAVAPVVPHGLSIEGRRVAWAEDVAGGGGRVRALELR